MNATEYYRSIKPDRDAWRAEMKDRCMCCGTRGKHTFGGLHIHEIERRSHAPGRWWHRSTALLLCEQCHAGEFASMPHARQLAFKLLHDRPHFDLERWLQIKDPELKAPDRVTIDDVHAWIENGRVKESL